jgi:hypothetical protein
MGCIEIVMLVNVHFIRQKQVGIAYVGITKDLEEAWHRLEARDSCGVVAILKLSQGNKETNAKKALLTVKTPETADVTWSRC